MITLILALFIAACSGLPAQYFPPAKQDVEDIAPRKIFRSAAVFEDAYRRIAARVKYPKAFVRFLASMSIALQLTKRL